MTEVILIIYTMESSLRLFLYRIVSYVMPAIYQTSHSYICIGTIMFFLYSPTSSLPCSSFRLQYHIYGVLNFPDMQHIWVYTHSYTDEIRLYIHGWVPFHFGEFSCVVVVVVSAIYIE